MQSYEIPLSDLPKAFSVRLSGRSYRFRVYFQNMIEKSWVLDIATADGVALANGIPLLPGENLLGQFKYLGMEGVLYVENMPASDDAPQWDAFPDKARMFWLDARGML